MKLTYQLTQSDLVKFNEYHSAHSAFDKKCRRKYRIFFPIIYLTFSIIFFLFSDYPSTIIFIAFAILWFVFYPLWQKKRYRKHFEKHVAETVGDSLKEPMVVELQDEGIHISDYSGQSLYKYSAVGQIVENESCTYIYFGKGIALILPHDRLSIDDIKALVVEVEHRKQSYI